MQIGEFIYGMLNGSIQRKQTLNVDKLLSEAALNFLYQIGRNETKIKEATFIYTWDSEKAITKTVIKPVSDENGRKDLLNHTVIVKFDNVFNDVLAHTNLLEVVEKKKQYALNST